MSDNDEIDLALRQAGQRWRNDLRLPDSVSPARMRGQRRGSLLRGAASSLVVFVVAALAVFTLSRTGNSPGASTTISAGESAAAPTSSFGPSASPSNSGMPAETLPPCWSAVTTREPSPPTIENRSRYSDIIVFSQLLAFGSPFWDSPSGVRPTLQQFKDGEARIVTPVQLEVSETLRGDLTGIAAPIVSGGEIGCDVFRVSGGPSLLEGATSLLFIGTVPGAQGENLVEVFDAWPVENDVVHTPLEGDLTLAQVEQILNGELPPPSPEPAASPGEPPPDYPETAPEPTIHME